MEDDRARVKTLSIREFFRQPKFVQDLVGRGERIAVARRRRVVFEVHPPPKSRSTQRQRSSVGKMARWPLRGDAAAPLPREENWP